MVKIKISYTERQELQRVLAILAPYTLKVKQSGNREGAFKKAYVNLDMNTGRSPSEHARK